MRVFTTDEIYVRLTGEDMAITASPTRITGDRTPIFLGNLPKMSMFGNVEVWVIGNLPPAVAAWISVLEKRKSLR